jgi:ATP/ADP translocase
MPGPWRDVRPDERRGVLAAFVTLFGILAAHTLLETARDALFLARLPPSELPWMYLAMAGLAVLVSQGPPRALRLLTGPLALPAVLLACAVVTALFWFSGASRSAWALRALYVWTGLVGTVAGLQFWLVLGEAYTIAQAKRIYRIIATGSLLGAVTGAAAARLLSQALPATGLVLAAAVLLALTAVGPALLLVGRGEAATASTSTARMPLRDLGQALRSHPYVPRLAGFVLISTVALTLADFVFKSAVARAVAPADMAAFFATFYTVLNGLALVAQVLLTGWLLRAVGLHRALWTLPALLLVGASGVAFGGGLLAAFLLKGADGSLRHSLHRTTSELLFLPIPDGLRARVKPLIDVMGQRGGQALASIFILSEVSLDRGDTVLAGAAAVLSLVWIAWAADLRPHYLELFRSAVRERTLRRTAEQPELDLASLEALFSALNSRDDTEVVAALDVLAEENRVRLVPALILYHPSKAVVLRALDLFAEAGRQDFVPVADRLLEHADPEVRASALRARTAVRSEAELLRGLAEDASPLVRATALAGLVSGGWEGADAETSLRALIDDPDPAARRALARAIAHQPVPAFEAAVLELADTGDEAVLQDVAAAMGALRSPRFLPALLHMLKSHELRAAAREALAAYGGESLRFLDEALADATLPHEIRRHVPRTISRFPPAHAASVLLRHLLPEEDGMVRFKILRGLGRMAADHPSLRLDQEVLRRAAEETLRSALRLLHWRRVLRRGALDDAGRRTPGHELLAQLLHDKQVHAVERAFRLFALHLPGEDWETLYRGLASADAKVRAGSREVLESALPPAWRAALLALVEDAAEPEQAGPEAAFATLYRPLALDYGGLMATLLEQPGETLRSLAAYHVGEIRLDRLRGNLTALQTPRTGLYLARIVERALATLDGRTATHAS